MARNFYDNLGRVTVYGVGTGSGSDINSNDILAAVEYPDKTTGNPSTSQQETNTVNALGQNKTLTDRNGTVHTYSFDVLARTTADAVTTLAAGVDGSVRRLETAYDTGGRPYLYTSFDAASGGNIVNQVQQVYNGLGQLITEYQSHSGAVNTSTTPSVQYAYSQMAGGANHSRIISMTYPNGRVLTYNYNSGVDDALSRLSSISDSSATLESYTYLGRSTIVKRAHPQPGVDLTYIKQTGESNGDAGDQYTGLDRFGRVVDQRWIVSSTGVAADRFQYGYDRDNNRLYRDNVVNSAFGELYHASGAGNGYDSLNQLTGFSRGTLSASGGAGTPLDTIASPSHSQNWSLDALGNWSSVTTDGSTQTRTANAQNQVTSISGQTTPTYDADGNMIGDQNGNTLVFDAWQRLVQVKSGTTVLVGYTFDALGRRIVENSSTPEDLYFSADWQVLEERASSLVQTQYVWSLAYVDGLIERDRDPSGGGMLSERSYAEQDANWNVTALLDNTGAVQERYTYNAYGQPTVLAPTWSQRSTSLFAWIYLYEGSRYQNNAGLSLFRNRVYSPFLGRWLSQDPLGFSSGDVNFYVFLDDTPVNDTDPLGLVCGDIHHPYPLHLGGSVNQPLLNLDKLNPNAHQIIHNYFSDHGFGFGDAGRQAWAKLSLRAQQAHIMRSLRAAGVPNSVIKAEIGNIMKGANPGVKIARAAGTGRVIPVSLFGTALLTLLTNPGTAQAAQPPLSWRGGNGNAPCKCECADLGFVYEVPSWWNLNVFGNDHALQRVVNLTGWVDYGSMPAAECHGLEGPIGYMEEPSPNLGFYLSVEIFSSCKCNGKE